MSRGGRSIILRDVDPDLLLRLIAAEHITEMFLVPAVLMVLLATPVVSHDRPLEFAPDLLRCVADFRRRARKVHGDLRLWVLPGLRDDGKRPVPSCRSRSKTTIRMGPVAGLLRSAGKPLHAVEIRIVDPDTGSAVQVGEGRGGADPFSLQTWRVTGGSPTRRLRPLTAGDGSAPATAGYFDAAGYLYLHDRIKDMIVSGGEKHLPGGSRETSSFRIRR